MKINIRGDKVDISHNIRGYVTDKLSKLNKYFKDYENIESRVVVKIKGHEQIIETTIFISNFTLRAEESHSDLYAAVDLVVDKLERQIRKNKTKLQERKFKGFRFDYASDNDLEEENSKIVKRKEIELKPTDEEEAILQIEMLGHDFFIYKDASTNHTCVLYKRRDGNYGSISTI